MSDHEVRDNADRHRFEIDFGDGTLAFATYMLSPGKITFTHSTLLIQAALSSARERRLAVVPVCPFFAAYMKKHAEV